jgi:hypothetical protein
MSKPLELVIFDEYHGSYSRRQIIDGVNHITFHEPHDRKRFADAELAAEAHAFILTDHKYPADPDEYGDEEWEAYSREYQEAEKTIWRFAALPHYDEVTS